MNTLKDIKIEELISENKKLLIEIEDKEHREIAIEYLQKLNKDLMYKLAVLRIKIKNLSV